MSSESGEVQLKSPINGSANLYAEKSDGEVGMNGNGNGNNKKINKFFSGLNF